MSTFKLIKDHLRRGAVTHYGGQAIDALADAIGKSVKETQRCVFRMHSEGQLELEPSKGFVTTISLKQREVRFQSEGGRRESKYATSSTGKRYRGTLTNDQVGPLSTHRASTPEEYIQLFGNPPPAGLFDVNLDVTDLTKEVTKVETPQGYNPIKLRRETIDRMQSGQLVQLFIQQQFNGEPLVKQELIKGIMNELNVTEHVAEKRLTDLEHVQLIERTKLGWQGQMHITGVSERQLDEIDMQFLLKRHGKVMDLDRRERLEVLVATCEWAVMRHGNEPFSLTAQFQHLGMVNRQAKSHASMLVGAGVVEIVADNGNIGRTYKMGSNHGDIDAVLEQIRLNERRDSAMTHAPTPEVKEESFTIEPIREEVIQTPTAAGENVVIRKDVLDQLVERAKHVSSLEEQLVERAKHVSSLEEQLVQYADKLASQADLLAAREAMMADMRDLIAQANVHGDIVDLTAVSSLDDLLR